MVPDATETSVFPARLISRMLTPDFLRQLCIADFFAGHRRINERKPAGLDGTAIDSASKELGTVPLTEVAVNSTLLNSVTHPAVVEGGSILTAR